jgi:hypothetical protein
LLQLESLQVKKSSPSESESKSTAIHPSGNNHNTTTLHNPPNTPKPTTPAPKPTSNADASLAFTPPPDPLVLVVPPADKVEVEVVNAPTDAPLNTLAYLYQKEITEKKNGKKKTKTCASLIVPSSTAVLAKTRSTMCITPLEDSTSDLMIFALALFELIMYAPELVVNENGFPEETNTLEGVSEERRVVE